MEHFVDSVFGWFNYEDTEFYKEMVEIAENGSHFVEVGSFKGRSSVFMAVEIINSGKEITFDCVDTWLGSDVHHKGGYAEDEDCVAGTLFEVFLKNIEPVKDYINVRRGTSVEMASTYENNSLDFVFIDADHAYDSVKEDINAWLPKVKVGGTLAGHDFSFDGVSQAVYELLPNDKVISFGAPICWKYVKE